MDATRNREAATLTDRFALAFLSGLSALLAGSLIWLAASLFFANLTSDGMASFRWVLLFAGVMALIGFALLENVVVRVLSGAWRGFLRISRWA